ncbi:MAG: hypothetical protein EBZ59_00600 [Planctomycetia bacterium]|nr:hypothetical protein [Planctomycetia bacterium]
MPTATSAADPLTSLVRLLQSSLAMYVADSGIWSYPGAEEIRLALADLVGDERSIVDRAGAILADRDVAVPVRDYPLSFTALHDVDLRFLLPRIVGDLRGQITGIDAIIDACGDDETARELAREARATIHGHIDVLGPLDRRPARS